MSKVLPFFDGGKQVTLDDLVAHARTLGGLRVWQQSGDDPYDVKITIRPKGNFGPEMECESDKHQDLRDALIQAIERAETIKAAIKDWR